VATYEYIALTPSGDRITGQMSAANEQAVLSDLESKSLSAVRIAEKAERSGFRIRRGVDGRKLATAYQQFSDLLKAGVPMLRALRLLGRSKSNVRLAAAFAEMADLVEDGEDLSAAMRRHADLFPDVQVAMIQAGEAGGFLDQVLARLGSFLNHQADLRGKLLGSMIYPGVLMTLGAVVLGVIFGFFIPLFREFLDELPRLPLPTKVILFLSTMVTKHGLITLVMLVGSGDRRVAGLEDGGGEAADLDGGGADADPRSAGAAGGGRALLPHPGHDVGERCADAAVAEDREGRGGQRAAGRGDRGGDGGGAIG
jgi:type II secretory pathway component PulF